MDWLARLRERCRAHGLNLVLPVDAARFDAEARRRGGVTLAECWPAVGAAVVIADGGPGFFDAFARDSVASARREPSATISPDPLDGFTMARVREIASAVFDDPAGTTWRLLFPFAHEPPVLPFQQLGLAAGLPPPGPLGLQIHPTYGPWWAYRALLLTAQPLPEAAKARVPVARGAPSLQMKGPAPLPLLSPRTKLGWPPWHGLRSSPILSPRGAGRGRRERGPHFLSRMLPPKIEIASSLGPVRRRDREVPWSPPAPEANAARLCRAEREGRGDVRAAASHVPETYDPCGSCPKPCVEACPAGAVTATGFAFVPCSARRLVEGSPCARTCVARAACPVGTAERYGASQLAFHMDASLVSLRRHVSRRS